MTSVRLGLCGVGSIIFHAVEEIMYGANASVDFYDNVIAPYKGQFEQWFVSNKILRIYFIAILVTIWAVVYSKLDPTW